MSSRLAAIVLALALPAVASAHDIPADVTVHAYVRPEGQRLRVLVRVPLRAMRDIDFPTRGAGFLDLGRADPYVRDAVMLWIAGSLEIYEGSTRLLPPSGVRAVVSLPSDRSFVSYEEAVAHIERGALPPPSEIPWDQGLVDASFEYAIASERSAFSIRPLFGRLGQRVVTVIRFLPPDRPARAFEYTGDPGLVRLDPRWHQAAFQFVKLGVAHILSGTDHLLFLLCLVIPLRRVRTLAVVVTAFTLAHSVTLIAAASGFVPDGLWFPPLVEALIAASIVYMALENILSADTPVRRRWALAFAFGLVHGFGFSVALRETLQFAGSHLLTSLLSFNAGIELGQLAVVALLAPVLHVLFTRVPERMAVIVSSAFVAHTGWHWLLDRVERVRQFSVPGVSPLVATRALMAAVAVAAAIWAFRSGVLRPRRPSADPARGRAVATIE
jgi:hydrogenase/urease accessory protein HupE